MAKMTKRIRAIREKLDRSRQYAVEDAFGLLKDLASAKFVESVDVSVNLGVDPRKSDQVVRGATVLPRGTGKDVRVAVFAQGEKADTAKAAGADVVGFDELAAEVKGGRMDFDVVIATPDAMRVVGQLGPVLGPRGLMPNPKTGTVTEDTARAVREVKAGRIEFKVDKAGNVHAVVAHSLGAAAVTAALSAGIDVERLVYIAPPADPEGAFRRAFAAIGLPSELFEGMKALIEERFEIRLAGYYSLALAPAMSAPPQRGLTESTQSGAAIREGASARKIPLNPGRTASASGRRVMPCASASDSTRATSNAKAGSNGSRYLSCLPLMRLMTSSADSNQTAQKRTPASCGSRSDRSRGRHSQGSNSQGANSTGSHGRYHHQGWAWAKAFTTRLTVCPHRIA